MLKIKPAICAGLAAAAMLATAAFAQEPEATEAAAEVVEAVVEASTAPAPDTTFIFNTLSFMIMGMVVMFMAAGFCMLEAGLVRSKNAATICLKNITLYAIATVMVWLVGYNLISGVEEGGYIGTLAIWAADDSAALETGYSASSDWFFQMVFVATAASIVSGTVAERVRLWPFFIFTAVLTGFIYPIQASWEWGAGWLDARYGFSDFAGSTLVHATGGWAALAGAIALGPRAPASMAARPRSTTSNRSPSARRSCAAAQGGSANSGARTTPAPRFSRSPATSIVRAMSKKRCRSR
jgi:ammonium transporter, Amt family